MMLITKLSNKFVMQIWLPWIKNLPILNKEILNYKLFLMIFNQLEIKRLDKRKQKNSRRLNYKRLLTKQQPRDKNKLMTLKLKDKNIHLFHQYWLKQEDSLQITSKLHLSYKKVKKRFMLLHKLWLKLPATWVKEHIKPAQWNTSELLEKPLNCWPILPIELNNSLIKN